MLHELILENFKPFGTLQRVSLSPITLVFGPNSGGKSSLIQAIMLMRQTLESFDPLSPTLNVRGDYTDLGSFKSLLHGHNLKHHLTIGFELDAPPAVPRRGRPPALHPGARRTLNLVFRAASSAGSRKKDTSEPSDVHLGIASEPPLTVHLRKARAQMLRDRKQPTPMEGVRVYEWADKESAQSLGEFITHHGPRVVVRDGKGGALRELLTDSSNIDETLLECDVVATELLPTRLVPKEPREAERGPEFGPAARAGWVLENLAWEFRRLMGSVTYLGPMRSYPARHYLISGGFKGSVGSQGENLPAVVYRRKKEIITEVNKWFEAFEIPYQLHVEPVGNEVTGEIVSITLVDKGSGVNLAPSDVGFGIGQLLPVLVEGVISRNRIICVEQPEIHLHPRMQAHLADLFIRTAHIGKKRGTAQPGSAGGNQWIVETHSESLMLRLQRRIREGALDKNDVSILYVEPSERQGSVVRSLRLDDDGQFIDEWPRGFFEESYNELFEGSA